MTDAQKMQQLVNNIRNAVAEAEKFSEETGLIFTLEIAYGMGGTYVPESADPDEWESSTAGWLSSSEMC